MRCSHAVALNRIDEAIVTDVTHPTPHPLHFVQHLFSPKTGTLLSALQTFFAPRTGTPSSLRDTPSNRGNYLTGEFPFKGAKKRDSGVKKGGHGKPCPYGNTDTGGGGKTVTVSAPWGAILHSAFCILHLKKPPEGGFFCLICQT